MEKIILIVDDSASIRNLVEFTLKNAGFTVISASNGKEALSLFDGRNIHLLLTDLHMPVMTGMELISEVRKMEEYKYLPILFLTTETQISIKQEAKKLGATGWIVKPFNEQKLIASIRKVIR